MKIYIGTNTELVKVWGIPFKEGEIREVHIIDEPYTHRISEYYDSDRTLTREIKMQIQQIDIKTDKDTYCINAPQWGYEYNASQYHINEQKSNFKKEIDNILSKMKIEKIISE